MRNLVSIVLLSSALMLGGCATMGGGGASNWDDIVKQVQGATTAVCAFVPTAQTVIELLSLGLPALNTVSQVAGAICAAVSTPREATRKGRPVVSGVPIRGEFVRR